jgi:hypothetical protein
LICSPGLPQIPVNADYNNKTTGTTASQLQIPNLCSQHLNLVEESYLFHSVMFGIDHFVFKKKN